jgi:hypothetical protein
MPAPGSDAFSTAARPGSAVPADTWVVFGGAVVGGLVVLFLLGRRNETRVRKDWELVLTPKGSRIYSSMETQFKTDLELMNATYDEAVSFRELGSMEDARELLDAGFRVIEHFAPNLLKLLAAMATFSRMVSAMAPVAPLRPQQFQVGGLRGLAYLNQVLHHFLVTTSERFRLRLYILGRSVGLAVRYMVRSTGKIASGAPDVDREWDQIAAIRGDLGTLTTESLESLKALLVSMATERKDVHDLTLED